MRAPGRAAAPAPAGIDAACVPGVPLVLAGAGSGGIRERLASPDLTPASPIGTPTSCPRILKDGASGLSRMASGGHTRRVHWEQLRSESPSVGTSVSTSSSSASATADSGDERVGSGVVRNRRHGRHRHQAQERLVFHGLNSTGKGQAQRLLGELGGERLNETAAVFLQEVWQDPVSAALWTEQLQRQKWDMAIVPSCQGPGGGLSAGVAIVTPRRLGRLSLLPGWQSFGASPEGDPGRVIVGYLTCTWLPRGGALLISSYMHTAEPITSVGNTALVDRVCGIIASFDGPYVWEADWNDKAAAVQAMVGVRLERLHGAFLAPRATDCQVGCYLGRVGIAYLFVALHTGPEGEYGMGCSSASSD